MKDGRLNADELKAWLNRPSPPRDPLAVIGTGLPACPKCYGTCHKCHGTGRIVVECSTPGWRMVDCGCAE